MELQIKDHVASVRSCLQYVNEEERPLEAVFVFPLPADAAVCHFSAKIEERGDRGRGSRPSERESSSSVAPSFSYG